MFLQEHCGKAQNRVQQVIDSAGDEIPAPEDTTSLWKERLLSSTLNAYESRLDKSSSGIVRRNDVELFLRETFRDKAAFDSRRTPNEASIMIYIGIDSYLRR